MSLMTSKYLLHQKLIVIEFQTLIQFHKQVSSIFHMASHLKDSKLMLFKKQKKSQANTLKISKW